MDDALVRMIDLKNSTGMLHTNIITVVPLPFYDDVGQISNIGPDVLANSTKQLVS